MANLGLLPPKFASWSGVAARDPAAGAVVDVVVAPGAVEVVVAEENA
jgi:hypothetical protein